MWSLSCFGILLDDGLEDIEEVMEATLLGGMNIWTGQGSGLKLVREKRNLQEANRGILQCSKYWAAPICKMVKEINSLTANERKILQPQWISRPPLPELVQDLDDRCGYPRLVLSVCLAVEKSQDWRTICGLELPAKVINDTALVSLDVIIWSSIT